MEGWVLVAILIAIVPGLEALGCSLVSSGLFWPWQVRTTRLRLCDHSSYHGSTKAAPGDHWRTGEWQYWQASYAIVTCLRFGLPTCYSTLPVMMASPRKGHPLV